MNQQAVEDVLYRSGGQCEAVVCFSGIETRCGRGPVQIHHMVKRARGGEILDGWITEHLIALCHRHHRFAEESGDDTGLLIDGYVISDANGFPAYEGSNEAIKNALGEIVNETR